MKKLFLSAGIILVILSISNIFVSQEKTIEQESSSRYKNSANGTIIDTKTGLMWALKDNGYKINWYDAKFYCLNYKGGGYRDWRMPTQKELASLYDDKIQEKYHITPLIKLSDQYVWAAETMTSAAAPFTFAYGRRGWLDQSYSEGGRALPVRGKK